MAGIWFFAAGLAAGCGLIVYAMVSARPPRPPLADERPPPGWTASGAPGCAATAKLIPGCGAWWGVAPDLAGGRRPAAAVAAAEKRMGRRADILHVYHRGGDDFPTPAERRLARHRLLLIDWTPSPGDTWAEIAAGAADRRVDRLAERIRRRLPGRFFLALHPGPERDVRERPGSGMTAADYAAMFRHVVLRLRRHGVRNAVTVMTFAGPAGRPDGPWSGRLYPGDDVVDWIGVERYAGGRAGDFAALVDHPRRSGFYRWTQRHYPGKPIMVAEWGVAERPDDPGAKVTFYETVRRQIRAYPQIKALVYAEAAAGPRGDTRFDTTEAAGRAFAELARAPYFSSTPVPGR
ncbi:hypothetical protein [Sphaerisporangium rufum]|nr:hypothetical protein [Sphaerisporangium rufum]